MKEGPFVTFEGLDGSGKSTQLKLVASWLKKRGLQVVRLRDPGGGRWQELARREFYQFLGDRGMMVPKTELLLFASIRSQTMAEMEKARKNRPRVWHLCDRWYDSSMAFQHYGVGISRKDVDLILKIFVERCAPDLTLLYDLPVEVATERRGKGGRANVFDSATLDFQGRVRHGYLEMAKTEPERFLIIDAGGAERDVFGLTVEALKMRLGLKGVGMLAVDAKIGI